MNDTLLKWFEISFDVLYLFTIWVIVILMARKQVHLTDRSSKVGKLFLASFFLLALGDTGHVGFRVLAYSLGGLANNPALVGLGALATAITVTFFYMLVAEIWRLRFSHRRGILWWVLMLFGVLRLAIMIPSGNMWSSVVPPYGWSLARNIPLMVQGIGVAILLLVDGIRHSDGFSKKVSIMIFLSYACYTPVILFIQRVPMLGMLMIPKTVAYVAIAVIAYRALFRSKEK